MRQNTFDGTLIGSQKKDLPFRENKWEAYKEADWFFVNINTAPNNTATDLYFIFYSDKEEADYIYFDICQLHSFEFLFDNREL